MYDKIRKILICCGIFAFMIALGYAFSASGVEAKAAEIVYEPKFNQTEARSMLKMINDFRKSDEAWYWNSDNTNKVKVEGLADLVYDYELEKVAMRRAAEIAISFSHTRPDGSTCWKAYDVEGYKRKSSAGENIAAGQSSASSAFISWREDNYNYSGQGHRRNMLSSNFKAIGIASVTVDGTKYWVQEFTGDTPSGEATEANDSITEMVIAVSESSVTEVNFSADDIEVEKGSTVSLPPVSVSASFSGSWPSREKIVLKNQVVFTADDEYVSISGDNVKGLKEGKGAITGSLLGKQFSINVTVKAGSVPDTNFGDVDGDNEITSKDVTLLRRFLAGGWDAKINELNSDVDHDGEVTSKDVTMLRRYLAGGWGVVLGKSV